MAIEIEKKYRLQPELIDRLRTEIAKFGGRCLGYDNEENTIYGGGILEEKAAILRVRKIDKTSFLTFKQRESDLGGAKRQIEYEIELSNAEALTELLAELGFTPRLVYEKRRETWKFRDVEIMIDELPFGWFLEVEGPLTAINEAEMLLDLDDLETIHETYPQLTMRLGVVNEELIEARFEQVDRI